jgi:hypothetical protein
LEKEKENLKLELTSSDKYSRQLKKITLNMFTDSEEERLDFKQVRE